MSIQTKKPFYRERGLYRLKGKPKPRKIFGFDIETYSDKNYFLCASIVNDKEKDFFTDKEKFKRHIATDRKYRNSFIFASNLMFDLHGIFDTRHEVLQNFAYILNNSTLSMAKTMLSYDKNDTNFYHPNSIDKKEKKNYYSLTFADTMSHLKASVKDLGKIIGVEKMERPAFLGKKPNNAQEWEYMKAYNIRDSYISFKFMDFLQENYNRQGAKLQLTVSSTGMDLFRRKYLGKGWIQEPREVILNNYMAYYGGRTEAFKRGNFSVENYRKIKVYDKNSLFPSQLEKNKFPYPQGYMKKKVTSSDIDQFEGVCEATLYCPKDFYFPLVPCKTDKLRFTTGYIKGYYDFFTLRKAQDLGYKLLDTGGGVIYEHTFRPFKAIVKDLYKRRMELKNEGNNAQLVVKLLMNSGIYGKFGFNFTNKSTIILSRDLTNEHIQNCDIEFRENNKIAYIKNTKNNKIPKYVFPILPLYTTSYSRFEMLKEFKRVGEGRVLYSDTDCIFTDRNLPSSKLLGDLKLEDTFEELIIVRPKLYAGLTKEGESVIKIKGFESYFKDFYDFKKEVQTGSITGKFNKFLKMRSGLRKDRRVNIIYEMEKTLKLNDDKRDWEKENFSMFPQESMPIHIENFK